MTRVVDIHVGNTTDLSAEDRPTLALALAERGLDVAFSRGRKAYDVAGLRVVGTAVTRGGSAKSTSEPAARAALEIAESRLAAPGVRPPELAVEEPEDFLGLLDTEVRWQGP